MKKLLIAVLLLVGCVPADTNEKTIKVTFVKNTQEIRQQCGFDGLESFGCAKDHGTSCEIVTIQPKTFDDQEAVRTLGHELLHCFWGPVHK
jgi:hypothetical protein